ncbi:CHASE2 domain-containing protein [Novosphingobium sp.]|uniref:CHASE2 domain-containing protein n=1 Tax=Novosphingobium sp. TaxID=1874826 RepID=UPI00286DB7E6|nr:CHASE2 domain-containing protein [Novosphingobium sp.]
MPRARLFAEWLTIFVLTLVIAGWAWRSSLTGRFDNAILDRALVAGASPANPDIVIIAIDERSLASEGQWPWNRSRIAALVDRVAEATPRAVLLDILFTEPSDAEADAALAASLRRAGNVALPVGLAPAPDRNSGTIEVPPIVALDEAALVTGHVGIRQDNDGPVRRIEPFLPVAGRAPVPHLALALHEKLGGAHTARADNALHLRAAGSFRTLPASAVLTGEVPAQFLAGKVIIIGATAQGLSDNFPVSAPAGSMMSGSELLANVYQNAGEAGFIAPLGDGTTFALLFVFIGLLFASFWVLRPVWCLWTALLCGALALTVSYLLAVLAGLWVAPGPVLLGLVIAYPLWGWRRLAAINGYLMAKADRLSSSKPFLVRRADGFDSVARAVNRLDFLVDELSERRTFLGRVVESTPDALFVFDSQFRLLTMNRRATAIMGAPLAAMEGETVAQLLARIDGALGTNETELKFGDGRIFVVTRSMGEPEAQWSDIHLAMLTDVTDQRRAEAERRHALEFLSHDMRAPQVAILGLTSGRADREAPEARFGRIRLHARRTLDLADNFVELARLGDRPLDIADTDLGALTDEAADRAYALATDQGARVAAQVGEDPVYALADGAVLSRVLDNLVGNAIKYGATLVTLVVAVTEDRAVIEIDDDGPGLPPERAGDPFKRFGSRAGEGKGGSGLGLAFVSAAIARHGGKITCRSDAGAGTNFRIELPLSGG